MLACTILPHGHRLVDHPGGYDPFSVDLTSALRAGENTLTVQVDYRNAGYPPFGHLVDYLTFGGIYRDVTLRIVHPTHIKNLFVRTFDSLSDPWLDCQVQLSRTEPNLILTARLLDSKGKQIASTNLPVTETTEHIDLRDLSDVFLWSLEKPVLYSIQVTLAKVGQIIDFGFCYDLVSAMPNFVRTEVSISTVSGLTFGLNRHQTYPSSVRLHGSNLCSSRMRTSSNMSCPVTSSALHIIPNRGISSTAAMKSVYWSLKRSPVGSISAIVIGRRSP